jgi:transposase, IS5 family
MHQQPFAEVSFERYRKPTRRERFLNGMNRVVPWAELMAVIEPVYLQADGAGRLLVGIERLLQLQCQQRWVDPARRFSDQRVPPSDWPEGPSQE